jgi:hypothetical protein
MEELPASFANGGLPIECCGSATAQGAIAATHVKDCQRIGKNALAFGV